MKYKIAIWVALALFVSPIMNRISNLIFKENIPLLDGSVYWFLSICFYGGIYGVLSLKAINKEWFVFPLFIAISLLIIFMKNFFIFMF